MLINKDWTKHYLECLEKGKILEEIAEQLDFDVTLEVGWQDKLVHTLTGASIQEFAAIVKKITAIYGSPGGVGTEESSDDCAPDLFARWYAKYNGIHDYIIVVRSHRPDCKYDPRSEYEPAYYRSGKYRTLHPECVSVLKELEDNDECATQDA